MNSRRDLERLITNLKGKKVLLITTSTRWSESKETAKSSQLAHLVASQIEGSEVLDVTKLKIYQCEGNVSGDNGNTCGLKASILKNKEKNPTGHHRCWASINHSDDELWKVSKPLLEADAVIFFASVRWGSANAVYQKVIERLNWLENRHTTLEEENILSNKVAGIVLTGHNWNVKNELEKQKQVLRFYGFEVPNETSFYWQWTHDPNDETAEGYKKEPVDFETTYNNSKINESFDEWFKKMN